jgi:uncharacterized protein with HEPN domain
VPPRDWRLRVRDILRAAERIQSYTSGLSQERFAADDKTLEAVSFAFIVIGEAASHVPQEVCERAGGVPWAKMRGMRNVVAHEYFGIDPEVVWETATRDIPSIVEPLKRLLGE